MNGERVWQMCWKASPRMRGNWVSVGNGNHQYYSYAGPLSTVWRIFYYKRDRAVEGVICPFGSFHFDSKEDGPVLDKLVTLPATSLKAWTACTGSVRVTSSEMCQKRSPLSSPMVQVYRSIEFHGTVYMEFHACLSNVCLSLTAHITGQNVHNKVI